VPFVSEPFGDSSTFAFLTPFSPGPSPVPLNCSALAMRWLARWSASRLPEVKKSVLCFCAFAPPQPVATAITMASERNVDEQRNHLVFGMRVALVLPECIIVFIGFGSLCSVGGGNVLREIGCAELEASGGVLL